MARLLKQLRFRWDEFALRPQIGSKIAFPEATLRFGNDFELLASEVARYFPSEKDNLQKLLGRIVDYDDLSQEIYDLYEHDLREGQRASDQGSEDIVDRANSAYNREFMFSLSGAERETLIRERCGELPDPKTAATCTIGAVRCHLR